MQKKELFKFKRYEIIHNKKKYVVMVPNGLQDNLWIVDWADWWFGTFIDGSMKGLKVLNSCFALLGFNPHVIVYLPIKDHKIPKSLSCNPDNGSFDIVFTTEQSRIKTHEWIRIRQKIKKSKATSYRFLYNVERIESYFKSKIEKYKNIPYSPLLNRARADNWLEADTAFFNFPTFIYQKNTLEMHEYFFCGLKEADFKQCYNEKYDEWVCLIAHNFVYEGREKYKYTEEKPSLTLNIELYDIKIINRYRKRKDYLINSTDRLIAQG